MTSPPFDRRSDLAIQTTDLGKRFGERTALERHRPRGPARHARSASSAPTAPARRRSIRLLLGLAEPTSGTHADARPRPARRPRRGAAARRRDHRGAALPSATSRGRENLHVHAAARDRAAHGRVDGALARVGLDRPRRRPRQDLLARHAPAPRRRALPAHRPRAADPRRAGERPRPGRHPRVPRAHPLAGRRGPHACCSPRTCSTRSRRPATSRRSSTTAASSPRARSTSSSAAARARSTSSAPARSRPRTLLAAVPGVTRATDHEGGLRVTLGPEAPVDREIVTALLRRLLDHGVAVERVAPVSRLARRALPDHDHPPGGPILMFDLRLIRAEVLKLRRRRGMLAVVAGITLGVVALAFARDRHPARRQPGEVRARRRRRQLQGRHRRPRRC